MTLIQEYISRHNTLKQNHLKHIRRGQYSFRHNIPEGYNIQSQNFPINFMREQHHLKNSTLKQNHNFKIVNKYNWYLDILNNANPNDFTYSSTMNFINENFKNIYSSCNINLPDGIIIIRKKKINSINDINDDKIEINDIINKIKIQYKR